MSDNPSGWMIASFNSKTRSRQKFNPSHAEVEMAIAAFVRKGGVIQELHDEIQCAVDSANFQIMCGFVAEEFSMI